MDIEYEPLLMWSGGIDSTYLLYTMLRDNVDVSVHHIRIKNRSNKWIGESIATRNLYKKFREMGLPFDYTKSTLDFLEIPAISRDSDACLFVAQRICRGMQDPTELVMGWIKDDFDDPGINDRAERGLTQTLWESLIASVDGHGTPTSLELKFPLKNVTKREIYVKLPKELRDLCSYCHSPIRGTIPCGECRTCKTVKEIK